MKARRTSRTPQYDQRADAARVVLRLPSPISVNELHSPKAGGGIRRSDRYEAWLEEAGWHLEAQRPGRIAGRYVLTFRLPRESGLDLDNGIKATSDLLQRHGVIRNDRDAEEIFLGRQDESDKLIVEVTLWVPAPERSVQFWRALWAADFDSAQIATITRLAGKPVLEAEILSILHSDQDRRHGEKTGRAGA